MDNIKLPLRVLYVVDTVGNNSPAHTCTFERLYSHRTDHVPSFIHALLGGKMDRGTKMSANQKPTNTTVPFFTLDQW